MKKKILVITGLLIMVGFSTFFFGACDKDTNCYVQVNVIDETTKMPMGDVFVKIYAEKGEIESSGTTDAAGNFFTEFKAPAIFNVKATYETGYDTIQWFVDKWYCYREGTNSLKLREGDTVFTTVTLEAEIHHQPR